MLLLLLLLLLLPHIATFFGHHVTSPPEALVDVRGQLAMRTSPGLQRWKA